MTSMQASDKKKESRPTGMTVGGFVARFGALFGLAILVIVLAILSPVFLKPDILWNIARQSTVNAMLAVGMLLAIITAGIDLSVGSVLALSMSVLATLAIKMHVETIRMSLSNQGHWNGSRCGIYHLNTHLRDEG